ncbi:hypothetical protein IFO70_01065 [Phormidium tenue FACHB-886]|nr:hypothetical protein [Phormidium tenue FACHB-886]
MAHRFRLFRLQAGQMRLLLEALIAPTTERPRWMTFILWLIIPAMLLAPVGVSLWAVSDLFGLPALPQCLTASWSDGNSAARLYCAKLTADRRTPQELQEAIELVSRVPRTDPLRPESDRLIQQWTEDVLRLGEAKFQDGNFEEALEIADRIPQTVQSRRLADDRIQQWKDIWDQATTLSEDAKQKLSDGDWYGALAAARQLLTLGNRYWATTQHAALMRQLHAAKDRDQNQKKTEADRAQKPTSNGGVQDYLSKIQQEQAADSRSQLNKARSLAKAGTAEGLQAAISEAQQVIFGTEGYEEAQAAIDGWRQQLELFEDRPILARALTLANKGDEASLQAAISEANQIGWGRALYSEANGYVEQWRDRVFQLQTEARTRQLEAMQGSRFSQPTYQPPPISNMPERLPSSQLTGGSNQPSAPNPPSTAPLITTPPPASNP